MVRVRWFDGCSTALIRRVETESSPRVTREVKPVAVEARVKLQLRGQINEAVLSNREVPVKAEVTRKCGTRCWGLFGCTLTRRFRDCCPTMPL